MFTPHTCSINVFIPPTQCTHEGFAPLRESVSTNRSTSVIFPMLFEATRHGMWYYKLFHCSPEKLFYCSPKASFFNFHQLILFFIYLSFKLTDLFLLLSIFTISLLSQENIFFSEAWNQPEHLPINHQEQNNRSLLFFISLHH